MASDSIRRADKNVVERRIRRNQTRDTLRNNARQDHSHADAAFTADLLQRHVRIQRYFRMSFVSAVVVAACALWFVADPTTTLLWTAFSLVAVAAQIWASATFLKQQPSGEALHRWQTGLYIILAAKGLSWAALAAILPLSPDIAAHTTIGFIAGLVIMAFALLSSYSLKFGPLLTTLPLALVFAFRMVLEGSMDSYGMAFALIVTSLFFQYLGDRLRGFWIAHVQSRVVRDQLIVDLEAATAISDEARRRAEEANLAKSRFLATMSHELRTPLNAILGFSEIMANQVMGPLENENYREYVSDIHRSGSHLLKLINEILDLSRVEAGRYEMNEEPVNLVHAAEECRQMVKLKASQKSINIVMQLQPNLPSIRADARAVRQVILNLLSNALKFTPSGGAIWIRVGWTAGGGQYIAIRDSGPGIAEDEIPIVLSSFGQGSIAIKSAEQGTGLGLPIVQALVHMHDGHFELKSKLREGTEVIASFPSNRVMAQAAAVGGEVHRPSANPSLAPGPGRQAVTPPPLAGRFDEDMPIA